jgi:hypothetical protein
MMDEGYSLDLAAFRESLEAWSQLEQLKCSDHQDLLYLGLLLPRHGWIECFRPLFNAALRRLPRPPSLSPPPLSQPALSPHPETRRTPG